MGINTLLLENIFHHIWSTFCEIFIEYTINCGDDAEVGKKLYVMSDYNTLLDLEQTHVIAIINILVKKYGGDVGV